jgi:hypothetical protein
MDEYTQLRSVLSKVSEALPRAVFRTCESLNEHGEWEMALDHCICHLTAVSPSTKMEILACAKRFGSSKSVMITIENLA